MGTFNFEGYDRAKMEANRKAIHADVAEMNENDRDNFTAGMSFGFFKTLALMVDSAAENNGTVDAEKVVRKLVIKGVYALMGEL